MADSNCPYRHGDCDAYDDQFHAPYRQTDSLIAPTQFGQIISSTLLFTGSAIIIAWGLAHIVIPTKGIIAEFGPITLDNRRILLMEWLMEGVLLVFLGVLVALVRAIAPPEEVAATVVYRTSAVVLIVMAGISLGTGARTRVGAMRLCPTIFTATAILYWLPTVL